LRVPPEIRRLIFAHVLAGYHVHVEQLHLGNIVRYEKKDMDFGQGLWNEICQDPSAEATAYEHFVQAEMGEDAPSTPFEDSKNGTDVGKGYHTDSWTFRHDDCGHEPKLYRFNKELEEWKQRPRISLSSLRSCKLIYKEMRFLPYSDNKFLFRSPPAFQAFAGSCRPEQFRAIQHISLPIAIGSAPYSESRSRLWTSILWDYNLTSRIRKLKHLDLTIELYFPRDEFSNRIHQPKPGVDDCVDYLHLADPNGTNVSIDWVKEFSHLSREISAFRLVVCDDPLSMWGVKGRPDAMRDWRIRDPQQWVDERNTKCLTIEQKQKLAEELEERLVAASRRTTENGKK